MTTRTGSLSLYHLLDPDVLADPYPLYAQFRQESPVLWDRFLHAWVLTRYDDVVEVLGRFGAECTPSPDRLAELGMQRLAPVAEIMVKQMLFMDSHQHRRVRALASHAFTARRVEALRDHIRDHCRQPDRPGCRIRRDGSDERLRRAAARDRQRRNAGSANTGSRAAQRMVTNVRADFRQLPEQPGRHRRGAQRNLGHGRVSAARADQEHRCAHRRTDRATESGSGAGGSAHPRKK